jgi:Subtilase family
VDETFSVPRQESSDPAASPKPSFRSNHSVKKRAMPAFDSTSRAFTASGLAPVLAAIVAALSLTSNSSAQNGPVSAAVEQEIASIIDVKNSFSPGEKRLSTNLAYASRQAQGKPVGAAAAFISPDFADPETMVKVVIRGTASTDLVNDIEARGGSVEAVAPSNDRIEATVPLVELEGLAARADVGSIRQPPLRTTNVGSLNTQGYVTHRANQAIASGQSGAGVKIGVLSDSATPARVAALIASGDLGPGTTVLPGQAGEPTGTNEGTAMMEIVQDLAPGSQLFFATAFAGESSFAANILALGAAGCKVIVDDVSYADEFPFQDSVIAKAVNTFVASGGIYFSSAGNSGGKTANASTTWEGDFKDGGTLTSGPIFSVEGQAVVVHDFGTAQTFNRLQQASRGVLLFWANPIGGATDDYDCFVLNSAGTAIKGFSVDAQDGTQDPIEGVFSTVLGGNWLSPAANDRIVVVRTLTSSRRAIHLESLFGDALLAIGTQGQTHGHNAGANTLSVAATFWNSAHTGTKPFNGTNNPTEVFSSDGPRKIFFNPDGTAITPGNFLFATNGGMTLQKPDFTAADGVTTRTPGFGPFFGTSAAAPHAAAIAALVLGANPALTNDQVATILRSTALDNMAPGADRDGGVGVLNAAAAVQAALGFGP